MKVSKLRGKCRDSRRARRSQQGANYVSNSSAEVKEKETGLECVIFVVGRWRGGMMREQPFHGDILPLPREQSLAMFPPRASTTRKYS